MASLPSVPVAGLVQEDRYRPPDLKSARSPKAKSSSLRHKTRSPAEAVRESEQSLNQLLEDFEEGRLNAFGRLSLSHNGLLLRSLIQPDCTALNKG